MKLCNLRLRFKIVQTILSGIEIAAGAPEQKSLKNAEVGKTK
jgi:hypothetical protein